MAAFKQICSRCKKNYVIIQRRTPYPICMECNMREVDQKVDDPVYQKLFDIPRDLYLKSKFLRDIKTNYLRFGDLTEKQTAAFKETVEKMQNADNS